MVGGGSAAACGAACTAGGGAMPSIVAPGLAAAAGFGASAVMLRSMMTEFSGSCDCVGAGAACEPLLAWATGLACAASRTSDVHAAALQRAHVGRRRAFRAP